MRGDQTKMDFESSNVTVTHVLSHSDLWTGELAAKSTLYATTHSYYNEGPDQCGSVGWAWSRKATGHPFDSEYAWVAGSVPGWGACRRQSIYVSLTSVAHY